MDKLLTIYFEGQRRGLKIPAWKYYEIVDELRSHGAEREEAYTAAKWASRTKTNGKYTDVSNAVLIVE